MLLAALAHAQGYPSKPVRLVVSSAAGGSPDLQARIYTQRMTQLYGYVWVIENLPGAGANIAPERAAKAPADGYTLLMASAGPLYFNPTLYTKLPYDIQRDFEPITQVSNVPNILAVHPSVTINSVKELIAYARANPGKLRFGSPGSGSSQHLAGELFKKMTGVDMQHVPYKSVAQMTTELPHVKAGRLRALAVTTRTRLALAPDVPTLDESGLAGYEVGGGSGVLAPKGTPATILKKLEADLRSVLNSAEVREQYAANGLIAVGSSSAEFAGYIRSEIARWAPLIRATGATVD
jgi:tripartite-type tricarboxylate transporter receptor subunit TctC